MRFKKGLAALTLLAASAATHKLVCAIRRALVLRLVNTTNRPQSFVIAVEGNDNGLLTENLPSGATKMVDLRELPLGDHSAVMISFLNETGDMTFRRTLLYDVDEFKAGTEALIVDYGQNNIDVKLV